MSEINFVSVAVFLACSIIAGTLLAIFIHVYLVELVLRALFGIFV